MNSKIVLTIINIILLLVVILVLYRIALNDCGKVILGENWTAKRYGSKYILSVKTGSDLTKTFEDFVQKEGIRVGSI